MNIDWIVTIALYFWAFIFLLLCLVFHWCFIGLNKKIDETITKRTPYLEECFTISWFQKKAQRKVVEMRGIFLVATIIGTFLIAGVLFQFLATLGYAIFVLPIGFLVFLDDRGFKICFYARDIQEEPSEKLQDRDLGFMCRWAFQILRKRAIMYLILAILTPIVAYFQLIPAIFKSIPAIAYLLVIIDFFGQYLGMWSIAVILLILAVVTALVDLFFKKITGEE
jgi:hypothetical protein